MKMTRIELDEFNKIINTINNLYESLDNITELKENINNNISCAELYDRSDDVSDYVCSLALDEIDALYNIRMEKIEKLKKTLKEKFDIDFIQNESW